MVNQEELQRALPEFLAEFGWEIVAGCVRENFYPGELRVAAMTSILLHAVLEDYRLRGHDPEEAINWLWHDGYEEQGLSRQIFRRIIEAMQRTGLTEDPDGRMYWRNLEDNL